jgi:hypothetical protein
MSVWVSECLSLMYDRRSVGLSVLEWSTHLGLTTRFLVLSDSCRYVDAGRSFWREDMSVVYDDCWLSPAQSFSGPSSVELATIFDCLRFETLPTWRARFPYLYPPGTEWPSYTPRHWVKSDLLALASIVFKITTRHGPHGKHFLLLSRMRVYWPLT